MIKRWTEKSKDQLELNKDLHYPIKIYIKIIFRRVSLSKIENKTLLKTLPEISSHTLTCTNAVSMILNGNYWFMRN